MGRDQVVAHLVHAETTFDEQAVRNHLTVLVLTDRRLVIGEVVGVHLDERFIRDGRVDTAAMQVIARCGYDEYSLVERVFSMERPE